MNMVFWMPGEKRADILLRHFRTTSICFDETLADRPFRNIPKMLFNWNGPSFLQYYAVRKKNFINLYWFDVFKAYSINKIQTIRFVRPGDDLEKAGKHVVTDSQDIDFIRLLFYKGKRVSYYNLDVKNNLGIMSLYDWEHLFLNPFQNCIIYPNGEVIPINHCKGTKKVTFKSPKMRDINGYNKEAFNATYSPLRKVRHMATARAKTKKGRQPVSTYMHIYYYNYLSLNYLLWKKYSTAMTVKRNVKAA
jgi:hypothetical protein